MRSRSGRLAAVIPAAGLSRRFGGASKLDARLAGKSVLAHTLSRFQTAPSVSFICIATLPEARLRVQRLCRREGITKALKPVNGGAVRLASVYNACLSLPDDIEWVLVHDAARPCVSVRLIEAVVAAGKRKGAAACGMPATMTVKQVTAAGRTLKTLPRETLRLIQTPQVVRRTWLMQAFAQVPRREWGHLPDDLALLERCNRPTWVIPGEPGNIKITTREDLALAAAVLRRS